MKKIPLTQGFYATVDDEDFERINRYKWYAYKSNNTIYARRNVRTGSKRQTAIQMHRDVMGCTAGDKKIVDHKNFNGLDNRKENLQVVSINVNIHRRNKQANNHTGYIGLSWKPKKKTWEAWVTINKRKIYCGCHKNPMVAAKMRDKVVLDFYHDNAILNFPKEDK